MERVIITKGRARGVRFQRPGKLGITQHHNIYANKEVIMSAGSIATPQILMLSGIGPKYHLQGSQFTILLQLFHIMGQNHQGKSVSKILY